MLQGEWIYANWLSQGSQWEEYTTLSITSQSVANNKKPRLDREMAVIPEQWNEFDNNISLTLYGNKMAYIDFNTESSVTIENEQMADFQKKIFRLLFKYLSKGR